MRQAVAYDDFLEEEDIFASEFALVIFSDSKPLTCVVSLSVYNKILKTDQYFIYRESKENRAISKG